MAEVAVEINLGVTTQGMKSAYPEDLGVRALEDREVPAAMATSGK